MHERRLGMGEVRKGYSVREGCAGGVRWTMKVKDGSEEYLNLEERKHKG